MQTSCLPKMSPGAPTGSDSDPLPTRPSSGSAHNSLSPPRQTSPPPNPAPPPAGRRLVQFSLSHLGPSSRAPVSLRQHPLTPPSHRPTRCPPPTPRAPPHNSQSFPLPPFRPLPPLIPLSPHPRPAATAASHRKSSRPPEIPVSPHRSSHKPAPAPRRALLPSETPGNPAAGEIAQALPNSASPSPRSTHSPA